MTRQAVVCERWVIPLDWDPDGPGHGDRWFGDWVLARTAGNSLHVTASWAAAQKLAGQVPRGATVMEYFGGLGCQALILRHLFQPGAHWVGELHPAGYEHLRRLFRLTPVQVARADAYAIRPVPAELVALDFGDMTAHKAATTRRAWLGAVLAAARRGVLMTDSGGVKLHLHRARYEHDLGGPCSTYPEYLASLDAWLRREFGWRVLAGYYQSWTAVLALAPGPDGPPATLVPPPPRPVGLHLVKSRPEEVTAGGPA